MSQRHEENLNEYLASRAVKDEPKKWEGLPRELGLLRIVLSRLEGRALSLGRLENQAWQEKNGPRVSTAETDYALQRMAVNNCICDLEDVLREHEHRDEIGKTIVESIPAPAPVNPTELHAMDCPKLYGETCQCRPAAEEIAERWRKEAAPSPDRQLAIDCVDAALQREATALENAQNNHNWRDAEIADYRRLALLALYDELIALKDTP